MVQEEAGLQNRWEGVRRLSPLSGTSVKSVYSAVFNKVDGMQTSRVLVNLDDSPLAVADLHRCYHR